MDGQGMTKFDFNEDEVAAGSDISVHLAMDEDETEWMTPAWCDWARRYDPDSQASPVSTRLNGLKDADMTGARLALADFSGVQASSVVFRDAELSYADFTEADLKRADFTSADLCMTDFTRADLREANLAGADGTRAIFREADLRGARLNGACMDGADLMASRFDLRTELPFTLEEATARGMIFTSEEEGRIT